MTKFRCEHGYLEGAEPCWRCLESTVAQLREAGNGLAKKADQVAGGHPAMAAHIKHWMEASGSRPCGECGVVTWTDPCHYCGRSLTQTPDDGGRDG